MPDIPRAYAEWLPLLDRFRDGDDVVLDALHQGSIEWSSVVAERWTQHVTSALAARLQSVSRRLQLNLNRSGGDAFAVARALLDARRALQPLSAFVALPCLPEHVAEHLKSELARWTNETQAQLEKNAREIRTDNGRLLKIMRDNSLTTPMETAPPAAATDTVEQPTRRGRRVIL